MKTTIRTLSLFLMYLTMYQAAVNSMGMPMSGTPPSQPAAAPTATVASPTPMGMPTNATTPQPPAAQGMPSAMPSGMPTAMPTSTTTPTATSTEVAQQEITQLNQIIENIKTAKKELKDQLKQIDDKLSETRTDIAGMRKSSSEILSKAQEADAQALLNTINASLTKVSATQTLVTGDLLRSFDGNIAKIQSLIEQGQALVKTIQAKGYQHQIAQSQLQTLEEKTKATAAAQAAAKEKLEAQKKQAGVWHSITGFFAKATHRIKNFFIGIKKIFTGEDKETKTTRSKQPRSLDVKKKTAEQPATIASTVLPATQQLITTQLAAAETSLKQLDEHQKAIEQKLSSLDQNTAGFAETLKLMQPTSKPSKADESHEPKWKQVAMFITSEFLDACAFVVSGVKFVLKTIYDYFFAGIINRFVGDVKEKIKEEESKGKKQLPKETKSVETGKTPDPQQTPQPQAPATSQPGMVPPAPTVPGMPEPAAPTMPSGMPTAAPAAPTPSTSAPMGSMPMA